VKLTLTLEFPFDDGTSFFHATAEARAVVEALRPIVGEARYAELFLTMETQIVQQYVRHDLVERQKTDAPPKKPPARRV
jgi:hypothetical protein